MGSPSACPYRVCIPWQGLLLTASLLTFWNLPNSAQTNIDVVPFNVAEGKEVLLVVHNESQNLYGYNWYKGERVHANYRIIGYVKNRSQENAPGPAHNGRETIYPNGTLLIQNVTHNDAGIYTLHVIKENLVNEEVTSQFYVFYESVQASSPDLSAGTAVSIMIGVLAGMALI
ncbi:CEACAM7 isoform 3 [Pan troglodytes]|uniref:CEACAM7 isoform 3 n=2 Tax=Pan troglodytes TaxID=9598 RepID=A0A6D2W8G7_PANTR|nr:CEACAM7 isoform 3 [Pan troglodytes]